ncbi:MAG: hypothetical protein WAW42_11080 [Candidatus Competibacteraceae bacterium]
MSQIPMATTYPVTFQKKMQAAQHWDVLTEDVANRLRGSLIGSGEQGRPIALYVQQPKYNSHFGEAFHNLLITHLMERGFSITENPAGGLPLTYDVQVVSHNDRGFIRPMPGLFTALASSVFVLRGVAGESSTAAWMLGAAGVDVVTGYITDNPNNEIIVTTSVMSGDRYVARVRDIYYISDNNVGQYVARGPNPVTTRIVEVVGP